MAATGRYTSDTDINRRFGAANVAAWSQFSAKAATADDAVVQAAIDEGEDWLDDQFREGLYAIPFIGIGALPKMIIKWSTIKAGAILHGNRGLRDTKDRDKINDLLDEVDAEILQYLSGQRRLLAAQVGINPTAPVVV